LGFFAGLAVGAWDFAVSSVVFVVSSDASEGFVDASDASDTSDASAADDVDLAPDAPAVRAVVLRVTVLPGDADAG